MNFDLLLSEQAILAFVSELLSIPDSRGEATIMLARARETKEGNKSMWPERLRNDCKL